jgi:hypothetical protein
MRVWLARDKHLYGMLTLFCGYSPFASKAGYYWHSSDPCGGTFRIESSDLAVESGKRRKVSVTIDVNGVAVRPLKG